MEMTILSTEVSEHIQKLINEHEEWKQFCYEQVGIPEQWFGPPLTDEEIEVIHGKFLLKYGL